MRRNAGASLVDLGDDVLGVEFHSKMNAIGGDTIQMLQAGVKEAGSRFRALVVGNDAPNFSAGANLMLLLLEAQEGNWDEIDLMVRAFQGATMALKYADVPVVVAPAGADARRRVRGRAPRGPRAGGRGNLHGAGRGRRRPDPRRRRNQGDAGPRDGGWRPSTGSGQPDPLPIVQRVFETIGFGKVSTSGPDARRLGYLRPVDAITMNRERLIADAKAVALARAGDYVQRLALARPSPLAAKGCWRRSSSVSTWRGGPAASAITTRSSGGHWRASSRAATGRTPARSPSRSCSTSSARRS